MTVECNEIIGAAFWAGALFAVVCIIVGWAVFKWLDEE